MQREEMVEENSGKGNNHCKGLGAEKNITHLRNKRETNVARAKWGRIWVSRSMQRPDQTDPIQTMAKILGLK